MSTKVSVYFLETDSICAVHVSASPLNETLSGSLPVWGNESVDADVELERKLSLRGSFSVRWATTL
jgi:hypothetical protein